MNLTEALEHKLNMVLNNNDRSCYNCSNNRSSNKEISCKKNGNPEKLSYGKNCNCWDRKENDIV